MSLCPAQLNRRSLLISGCFTTSCPFAANSGPASCDLTGLIVPGARYSVNATAIKADGKRKSQSTGAPLPTITVPLFP